MISEKMMGLGKKSSVIREIFEYGKKRKAEIGAENVFDFSTVQLFHAFSPSPCETSIAFSNKSCSRSLSFFRYR